MDRPSPRNERLLALAWQAVIDGGWEIVLTDEGIDALTGDERLDVRYIPPHVELAARIHAPGAEALQRGSSIWTHALGARTSECKGVGQLTGRSC